MSDEEITTNNSMDIDLAPNESSSSSAPATSSVILDIGIGSGDISDSDDEDVHEPTQSKNSTPDSTTLLTTVPRKPITIHKPSFTKNKSSLVNYEPESDDEEHTDDEEENETDEEPHVVDDLSNSNSAVILHATGEPDFVQIETSTCNEQTIVTSDLLNVTPFKQEESSPTSRNDLTP
ncbi:unnamed protein product, partial [Rotaria magnacalcarata]